MAELRPAAGGVRGEDVAWLGLAAVVTVGLVAARGRISATQVALAYLLVVLAGSARRGRRIGFLLGGICFLAFNFFFVVPYGTLAVHDPLDWLVLLAFLTTSLVAAQLLHRAQSEAAAATARSTELQRLAGLGAEALQAPRAEEAAAAIARVIREEFGVRECELLLHGGGPDQLELVAWADAVDMQRSAEELTRTTTGVLLMLDPRRLVLPLQVHDRQVGLLLLRADVPLSATSTRHPFAEVLCYYAALGLERIRLTRAAERAEHERAADRIKDAMLSAVSHDIRTPLTSIRALAHAIAADGDERAMEIQIEAERLNRYVSNLLDLSRINAGAVPVHPELVPVDDLLGVLLQQISAVSHGRDVTCELPPDWTRLVGHFDYGLTLRVLSNLVENALRYSIAPAPVELRAVRAGDVIRFEVADRGAGIPSEEKDRLFQPFQRGTSGNESQGAGLGLAIARQLTEAQGGTLTVTPRPGGGSVFAVTLPAARSASLQAGSL